MSRLSQDSQGGKAAKAYQKKKSKKVAGIHIHTREIAHIVNANIKNARMLEDQAILVLFTMLKD